MSAARAEDLVEAPKVLEDLDDGECALWAILQDRSGIDGAEFFWHDPDADDGCFRAWHFQYAWWRDQSPLSVDQCARAVGKTLGIELRACAFPNLFPGQEMVITAPEMVHLDPITNLIETRVEATRFYREQVPRTRSAVTHRPFRMNFTNGARIVGRIPQRDGKGVKGVHPIWLELDEGQDYPAPGWVELIETLKRGHEGAVWRVHGVTRGVRDHFYEVTQDTPDNKWRVHRIPAMMRPNWSDEERSEKIQQYGSRDDPDYRRNVLGLHGDATNPMFVLHRLMKCWAHDTLVWVVRDDKESLMPIQAVRPGDHVLNAVGVGQITGCRSSKHGKIVRLFVEGESLSCSLDHPILSSRGWVEAQDVREGDELVRYEDMRSLWRSVGWSGETILQSGMSGQGNDAAETTVRTLRGADLGPRGEVLLGRVPEPRSSRTARKDVPVVRGTREALPDVLQRGVFGDGEADSSAVRSVPTMRKAPGRTGAAEVLLDSVSVRGCSETSDRATSLRGLRNGFRIGPEQAVLLADVCREVRWADLPGFGYGQADIDRLRQVRDRILPGIEEGEVLFVDMRESLCGRESPAECPELLAVPTHVPTGTAISEVLLERLHVESAGGGPEAQGRPFRRTLDVVPCAGRMGHGLAAGGGLLPRGRLGESPDPGGPGEFAASGGGRGRRLRSSDRVQPDTGQGPRRLAPFARVDRVEVLQPGDPEFDRLSGGEDHVVCYDLTVSGHPSFCVGEQGVIVHNCTDPDQTSDYNANEYYSVNIKSETLQFTKQDVAEVLDFPARHLQYAGEGKAKAVFWAGMDVGYTIDPTEILVFVEYRHKPRDPQSRLRLLARVHLERVGHAEQVAAILSVIRFYRPVAFSMDKTGLGLPLFTDLQERCRADPELRHVLDVVKGYGFGEKILVDLDSSVELPDWANLDETIKAQGLRRSVLEHASDLLRGLVDAGRLELPWDTEVLKQFQGSTWSMAKGLDLYGRRLYSKGNDHILDAARMTVLGHAQHSVETMLAGREPPPVLDAFVQL